MTQDWYLMPEQPQDQQDKEDKPEPKQPRKAVPGEKKTFTRRGVEKRG